MSLGLHIYPLNDEREHVLNGGTCWCRPKVEWIDPDTGLPWACGEPLVIHNAADCRELIEEAEVIKDQAGDQT